LNYHYPGNVRELENILEHACLLCQGDVVQAEHLPWSLRGEWQPPEAAAAQPGGEQRQRLVAALESQGWNRTRAARSLGIDRTTLWRRMKRHGISGP
jgi:transcriptional regulator of acetoin/glycerol metabolism